MSCHQDDFIRDRALRELLSVWPRRENPQLVGNATLPASLNGDNFLQFPPTLRLEGTFNFIHCVIVKLTSPSGKMS